ncbi:hypothetical protein [Fulvimarina sp. MAC3]
MIEAKVVFVVVVIRPFPHLARITWRSALAFGVRRSSRAAVVAIGFEY